MLVLLCFVVFGAKPEFELLLLHGFMRLELKPLIYVRLLFFLVVGTNTCVLIVIIVLFDVFGAKTCIFIVIIVFVVFLEPSSKISLRNCLNGFLDCPFRSLPGSPLGSFFGSLPESPLRSFLGSLLESFFGNLWERALTGSLPLKSL